VLVSNSVEDVVEFFERHGRESRAVQRGLVGLRERIAGFSSDLSQYEINLCAAAIARHAEGDTSLSASDTSTARRLLSYFSDQEWNEIERAASDYQHGIRVIVEARATSVSHRRASP